ncbi:MAG: hypothetical protein AMJ92_01735 [candidate division Zixibacteria bacterium SM23_81]|nr:MAG: hypothetical protein AMJ92_01735 [candidate division Zixibacteria bacterium SM23_81]
MRSKQSRRIILVLILGAGIWVSLIGRLFFIQILHRGEYRQRSQDQHLCESTLKAQRGVIYDRDGAKLVCNLPVKSYYVDPTEVKNLQRIGANFARLLKRSSRHIIQSLDMESTFVWLIRMTEPKVSQLIDSWNIAGVFSLVEMKRFYPCRQLGCQVIGFTDVDNKGLEGLELQFDDVLRGRDGWAVMQRDAHGRRIPLTEYPREEPRDGYSLVVTIHAVYQTIAEQELARGIQKTSAKAGCVILMDPATGEILAMANEPQYDPNSPSTAHQECRRNRAITDIFEPGSTFKIVAAAAALEEGVQNPDDLIYCEEGSMELCRTTINDVDEFGWLTFEQVIEKSSNIGIIKVANQVGEEPFFDYARRFGFGNLTGISLPGEVKGLLASPKTWSRLSLASMAMGHEVAVTSLQLVCAYAAVANSGTLMKPLIVRYVLDTRGNVVQEFSPSRIRRVISPKTAATLKSFLVKVVERGTGKLAAIDGLCVAGKTGTAYKLREDGSGFSRDRFMASFCGFFPAESPRLVGLVVLDEPRMPHSGGQAATPIFRRIAERILALPKGPCADLCLMVSQPDAAEQMVVVPDLSGLDKPTALVLLQKRDLAAQPEGEGLRVCHQQPQAGVLVARGETILMVLGNLAKRTTKDSKVPHVIGLTLREAIRQLRQNGLAATFAGSGLVIRQTPKAGSRVGQETVCKLECEAPSGGPDLMADASSRHRGMSEP